MRIAVRRQVRTTFQAWLSCPRATKSVSGVGVSVGASLGMNDAYILRA